MTGRSQTFHGMGGHHSAVPRTVEWLTPPSVLNALGGWESFDLDPATPARQPYPTARSRYTRSDNGLLKPWFGRVWLNPPYTDGELAQWLGRMADHGVGLALIFARTETDAFFRWVWDSASAILFLRGRLNFHLPGGERAKRNAGAPSVLCSYGHHDRDVLAASCLDGKFIPLILPRAFVITAIEEPWRALVLRAMRARRGAVRLDDLYREFSCHPRSQRNPHWRAKIRQTLQQGPFQRVGRGEWVAAQ